MGRGRDCFWLYFRDWLYTIYISTVVDLGKTMLPSLDVPVHRKPHPACSRWREEAASAAGELKYNPVNSLQVVSGFIRNAYGGRLGALINHIRWINTKSVLNLVVGWLYLGCNNATVLSYIQRKRDGTIQVAEFDCDASGARTVTDNTHHHYYEVLYKVLTISYLSNPICLKDFSHVEPGATHDDEHMLVRPWNCLVRK